MLSSHVLVLNRSFLPVHVTTVRHAICMLYRGIAKVVDREYALFDFQSWTELAVAVNDEHIGMIGKAIRVPRVVMLHLYDRIPKRPVRFSRLNVYIRDYNTCQYCGRNFSRSQLNLDHIVPVSLGGKTDWENVVCSCVECNIKKGGRIPVDAGMKLLKTPIKPHWSMFLRFLAKPVHYEEWRPYLNVVDYSYWNLELKQ